MKTYKKIRLAKIEQNPLLFALSISRCSPFFPAMATETGDHFGSLGAVLLFFFALTKFENPQKIRQATVKQNPILFALSNGALRARRLRN